MQDRLEEVLENNKAQLQKFDDKLGAKNCFYIENDTFKGYTAQIKLSKRDTYLIQICNALRVNIKNLEYIKTGIKGE